LAPPCAPSAFSASPAFADQFVEAADNAKIDCVLSRGELTRIALIDDGFANVSKIASTYPYNDFTVTHEPVRGDIYISVPPAICRRPGQLLRYEQGGLTSAVRVPDGRPRGEPDLRHQPGAEDPRGRRLGAGGRSGRGGDPPDRGHGRDAVLPGFTARAELGLPRKTGGIEVQLVAEYSGAELVGQRLALRNLGKEPLDLAADREGPAGTIAFAYGRNGLRPGETTSAFLVFRKGGLE